MMLGKVRFLQTPINFRLQIRLFVALLALSCFGIFFFQKLTKEIALKYKSQLLDDVLVGTPKPSLGNSIFFHDTSNVKSSFDLRQQQPIPASLTARAACAVESAALHSSNQDVFVLFASPVYVNSINTNSYIKAILSYPNVHLRSLDLWKYAAETPLEKWFATKKLFESRYIIAHTSDFLRFITLWRYGGTYLDMDVIVLRNLSVLSVNYVGAQSKATLADGVMNFGYDIIGRRVLEYCLNDFQHNFNGSEWSRNGPGVLTRTLKHFCKTNRIDEMFDKERCDGFRVYRTNEFYAVDCTYWRHFFDEDEVIETLKRIQNSTLVHVWNHTSKTFKQSISKRSAYGVLAAKHCPKVFSSITDYF